MMKIRAAG